MFTRLISAAAISGLLAMSAFAQGGLHAQAQGELESAGVNVEIPADATEEQLGQIIALSGQHEGNPSQLEMEVKKVLGME
ncbi:MULTISPECIES: hypothetical protein [Tropicimonas]|uniref:Uncharacterized protein n=2 Tax=Tropicimonas TaxID=599652 RepID=A0A239I1F0_9RHOB|nr:hypothetical protein [Tropicimonas sediminicola]SNS87311.1 hypothetical protein SAMN05421757_104144 [Tropicimonas sediminicola]